MRFALIDGAGCVHDQAVQQRLFMVLMTSLCARVPIQNSQLDEYPNTLLRHSGKNAVSPKVRTAEGREHWSASNFSIVCWMGVVTAVASVASQDTVAQDRIENVTVWAQKRDASLQDVPVAVAVLTEKRLADAGIRDIDRLAGQLPLLDVQRSASTTTTTLRIRRVGNLGNIPTFEPAVGLFVDGAFRSRSFLAGDLLDVQRIEVLAGPQSALYGKSASGGVVAIYTKKPGRELEMHGELTGGMIDAPESAGVAALKFGASGPLSAALGASLSAAYAYHDHILANALAGGPDGDDLSRVSVRGQLMWSPTPQLDLRLIAGYVDEKDDQGESDVFLAPGAGSTAVAGLFQRLGVAPVCPDNVPRNRTTCSVATNKLDLRTGDLTLVGEYRLGGGWLLTSVTGWDAYEALRSDDDVVQLFAPILFYRDSERGESIQEELRVTSANSEPLSWLGGIHYYANRYDRGRDGKRPMFGPTGSLAYNSVWPTLLRGIPLELPNQEGLHDSQLDTNYLAVFGQVSWALTERLSLTTGMRWQSERKEASINNSVTVPGVSLISTTLTPAVSPGGAPVNGAIDRETHNVDWSVTPQFQFSEHAMAYITVARGSKSGGFNTGFGNAPLAAREFKDESIRHYELGSKVTLADGRMRISTAAFFTEYHDYQDAAFLSAQFSVGNAGQVDLSGFELEGEAQLSDRLMTDFSLSYADLQYKRNTTGMCYPGRPPDGSLPGTCDLRGEHPIDAPLWTTQVGLQYAVPARWGGFFSRLDWQWTDEYNTSFSADPESIQQHRPSLWRAHRRVV